MLMGYGGSRRWLAVLTLGLLVLVWQTIPTLSQPSGQSAAHPKASSKSLTNTTAEGFRLALPGYRYVFPQDFGAHPGFKTEWWYTTGNLTVTGSQRRLGYELTFFRIGLPLSAQSKAAYGASPWRPDNIYMTHFALTDPDNPDPTQRFVFTEKFNRGAFDRAGAQLGTLNVWNEHWQLRRLPPSPHAPIRLALLASTPQMAVDFTLQTTKPPAIHGVNGVSQKADCHGCASHYYSLTQLQTQGAVRVGNATYPVTGRTWLDQEFGSNQLTAQQVGWDWFSLQLNNGTEVMLYQMRQQAPGNTTTRLDPNSSGSWVSTTGQVQHLTLNDFTIRPTQTWTSPHTQAQYPAAWTVAIPSKQLALTVTPLLADQELHPDGPNSSGSPAGKTTYWEGACRIAGTQAGQPIKGVGYVELTGYADAFRQRL
jgi:predicted secreted hydrolase